MKPKPSLLAASFLGAAFAVAVPVVEFAASYSSTVLSENPIAYWRFNDGVQVPVFDLAVNKGSLGAAANATYSGATHPVAGGLASGVDTAAAMSGGQNV